MVHFCRTCTGFLCLVICLLPYHNHIFHAHVYHSTAEEYSNTAQPIYATPTAHTNMQTMMQQRTVRTCQHTNSVMRPSMRVSRRANRVRVQAEQQKPEVAVVSGYVSWHTGAMASTWSVLNGIAKLVYWCALCVYAVSCIVQQHCCQQPH